MRARQYPAAQDELHATGRDGAEEIVALAVAVLEDARSREVVGRLNSGDDNGQAGRLRVGMQRLAQYLTKVDPVLQQQFVMLTASIADKAVARTAGLPRGETQPR